MIIVILIYMLSVAGAYLYVQKSHYDPKGIWREQEPGLIEIFLTFMPGVNTGFSLIFIFGGWKDSEYRKIDFFKPKDKL